MSLIHRRQAALALVGAQDPAAAACDHLGQRRVGEAEAEVIRQKIGSMESGNYAIVQVAQALAGAGFVLLQGQALAWVPIDFENIEAYLAALSSGRRRDLRRKLRSRAASQGESCAADLRK